MLVVTFKVMAGNVATVVAPEALTNEATFTVAFVIPEGMLIVVALFDTTTSVCAPVTETAPDHCTCVPVSIAESISKRLVEIFPAMSIMFAATSFAHVVHEALAVIINVLPSHVYVGR